MTTILITGADGFIGRNLKFRLEEEARFEVIGVGREDDDAKLLEAAARAEFVFHLAGVNRPKDPVEFETGNVDFTEKLCAFLQAAGNHAPVAYTSSISASSDNAYGTSKHAAENVLLSHSAKTGAVAHIFRLPNVFGKWARPNYNSAVATFCHNTARELPIHVIDTAAPLRLVYIDDVIDIFISLIDGGPRTSGFRDVPVEYATTVGQVADIIASFSSNRQKLVTQPVGLGLTRALYATYLSYLEPAQFSYQVPVHGRNDPRGIFVEMLKTQDSGQFSYFIAHPGVTRGDHYHHSKSEKFLVIQGKAHFGFRHIGTGETFELVTDGGEGTIVETIPGWTHNISNIGNDDLICMLWANEIFDPVKPDTIHMKVSI